MICNSFQRFEYFNFFIFINVLSKIFFKSTNCSTFIKATKTVIIKKIENVNLTIKFNKCVKISHIHNK